MDPKVFLETGQTNGKNLSGNATDTSGENAKQAGKAFKEAFNAATAAGNVDPKATTPPEDVDSKAITSSGNVDPKAITTSGNVDPKAAAINRSADYTEFNIAGNGDSLTRDLAANVKIDSRVFGSVQPLEYGKSLPHSQETGNFGPSEDKRGSERSLDPKALVNDTKPKAESQRLVAEAGEFLLREAKDALLGASNSQVSSSESSAVELGINAPTSYSPHAEFGSQSAEIKTDKGRIVSVKTPQGLIDIALPNGPASFLEVAEFVKSQSLPSMFTSQVLSSFKQGAASASNNSLLAEQMTTATQVFEVDTGVGPGESVSPANAAIALEEGTLNQTEKLASSTVFIDQLASLLVPKPDRKPLMQQSVEVDRGEVAALIKRTLSSPDGSDAKVNATTYELTDEAIKVRDAVIEAIGSDKSIKLSDFDVNKLANLLEPKFFSAVSSSGEAAVKTQLQEQATRAAKIIGTGSFWSLNDNGDVTTSKAQISPEYRFGVSPTSAGTPNHTRPIEFDSSIIAAQKLVGRNSEGQSSSQSKFETLDVEAPMREKTLTSSDALNLRNFAHNLGKDDSTNARPLSSSLVMAPVSTESQSVSSTAPLTNSVGNQSSLNYFASTGVGDPLVSRSTNTEGSLKTQYQSSFQSVRDAVALNERFTQVLTERLVQNVKSGNYNLRFNVHPRELGAVDIAMEVRDGRLDAQISSTNPVTRDLLSESLPRLRDALQAGGLQLSNLEVNDNARDNQKRGLMSSDDHDDSAIESNETVSNLLVEDLTLDAESVDYLA